MTTFTVTGHLETDAGAAIVGAQVLFIRSEWLSGPDGTIPPATSTATSNGTGDISISLRATTESGVTPQDWRYKTIIRVSGQTDVVGFLQLEENLDLADIFPLGAQPQNPDIFVTRAEFNELETALGDPASQTDLDEEIAARIAGDGALDTRLDTAENDLDTLDAAIDTVAANLATEITNRGTDVDAEQTRATAAENALDARLDTEEAATTSFDSRIDALEAAPAGTNVVNTDGDPGTTIYIGTVEPTDPPYDLAVGDVWIDVTPA